MTLEEAVKRAYAKEQERVMLAKLREEKLMKLFQVKTRDDLPFAIATNMAKKILEEHPKEQRFLVCLVNEVGFCDYVDGDHYNHELYSWLSREKQNCVACALRDILRFAVGDADFTGLEFSIRCCRSLP